MFRRSVRRQKSSFAFAGRLNRRGLGLRRRRRGRQQTPGHRREITRSDEARRCPECGRIPDGGSWRAHGRAPDKPNPAWKRRTSRPASGYSFCIPRSTATPIWCTRHAGDNVTAATVIDFMNNARLFFVAQGVSRIGRVRRQRIMLSGSRFFHGRIARSPAPPHSAVQLKRNGMGEHFGRILRGTAVHQ